MRLQPHRLMDNQPQHLKDRIKTNAQEFLSYQGIKECYKDLRERDLINEDYFVNEIELSV